MSVTATVLLQIGSIVIGGFVSIATALVAFYVKSLTSKIEKFTEAIVKLESKTSVHDETLIKQEGDIGKLRDRFDELPCMVPHCPSDDK